MPKENPKLEKPDKKVLSSKSQTLSLKVPVVTLDGKPQGTMELPKEIFGGKINRPLIAQAIRVYQSNQKAHFGSTKTRGEVQGSTRKIYKQKGTGGARHGSIRAPIFVGGGIALGPKYRKVTLNLPEKMRKAALIATLSQKAAAGAVVVASGIENLKKTSQIKKLTEKLGRNNFLLVTGQTENSALKTVRNLSHSGSATSSNVNILDLVSFETLILTKQAVENLEKRVLGQETTKKEAGSIKK